VIRRKRRFRTPKIDDSFDKSFFVEPEIQDKFTLWMLRSILYLGGDREFIDKNNYFHRENVAFFLDVEEDPDESREEVLQTLSQKLEQLEKQKTFTSLKTLSNNIEKLSKLLSLSIYEKEILEFAILLLNYEILEDTFNFLGNSLNTKKVFSIISVVLDIPLLEVKKAFSKSSIFHKAMILTIDNRANDISRKLDIVSLEFGDNMLSIDGDIEYILKDSIRKSSISTLDIDDFKHIKKDINTLIPYLKHTIKNKISGVNILLYGIPGTGKTELSKLIAKIIKVKLYEISYANLEDEPIDGHKRLKAYRVAQALFSQKKSILLYDEAEDIFESSSSFFGNKRQKDKAWLNKILENNIVPTIWITNNINSVDNAIIRRFDMVVNIPIPNKKQRKKIIKSCSSFDLDKKTLNTLSSNPNIAPALITRASNVVSSIDTSGKNLKHLVDNTLLAQGYRKTIKNKTKKTIKLPDNYSPKFINTSVELKEFAKNIKKTKNARICLYGPAGTGKSLYGQYIAKVMKRDIIVKKASDLISKWVGESEKNIANAFGEAKKQNAVLIFDEVDSFLSKRDYAKANWEVTLVNEMLVQMESFDGVFIATTNIIEYLDKASLRRFDIKLKFDYLDGIQNYKVFKSYMKILDLDMDKSHKDRLQNIQKLTNGDFATIYRQNRFRTIKNGDDFIDRLEDEVEIKNGDNLSQSIGFL
jgi:transitional endoplasmic reticulum ATPase